MTWATQTVRRVSRHKALTSIAAVALLAAAGAAWMARQKADLQRAVQVELREKAALQVKARADLREKSALFLDAALSLRRAGVSMQKAERDYLPRLRSAVAEADRVDPGRAEPHWRLGRLCRALMRFDEALAAQERALAFEPAYATALYERAVLGAREFATRLTALREAAIQQEGARLAQAGKLGSGVDREIQLRLPSDALLEKADGAIADLHARVAGDLAALERAAARSDLSAAQLACARGLALAYGPEPEQARAAARTQLEEALAGDPALEEAYEALAHIGGAAKEWDAVASVLARGLEVDRGYVPFWRGLGVARHRCRRWPRRSATSTRRSPWTR